MDLSTGSEENLLGDIRLEVRHDVSVCKRITATGYDRDLGIRSLITSVRDEVEGPLVAEYLNIDDHPVKGSSKTTYCLDLRQKELVVYKEENQGGENADQDADTGDGDDNDIGLGSWKD